MGRNTAQSATKTKAGIHPIWRGIGCIWLTILPIISFAASWIVVRENMEKNWIPFKGSLSNQIVLPILKFPGGNIDLNILVNWIPGQPLYYADLLVTAAFIFLGFGLVSVFYAFIFNTLGPPKDPYDIMERRAPKKRRK